MKNVSTGLGIAAWPVLDRLMPQANAVGVGATIASSVTAAATAQDAPTVVWYDSHVNFGSGAMYIVRAWSDGRVEWRAGVTTCTPAGLGWESICPNPCPDCQNRWGTAVNPAQGLAFDADLNFDEAVDGIDLGMMLAEWEPAPRNPVPTSDCPLALINP